MKTLKLIKNIVDVDVDGLNAKNHYTIKAMYDEIGEDGFAEIVFKTIDEFDYTWADIEKDGGIAQVNADLRECYGVEI